MTKTCLPTSWLSDKSAAQSVDVFDCETQIGDNYNEVNPKPEFGTVSGNLYPRVACGPYDDAVGAYI